MAFDFEAELAKAKADSLVLIAKLQAANAKKAKRTPKQVKQRDLPKVVEVVLPGCHGLHPDRVQGGLRSRVAGGPALCRSPIHQGVVAVYQNINNPKRWSER